MQGLLFSGGGVRISFSGDLTIGLSYQWYRRESALQRSRKSIQEQKGGLGTFKKQKGQSGSCVVKDEEKTVWDETESKADIPSDRVRRIRILSALGRHWNFKLGSNVIIHIEYACLLYIEHYTFIFLAIEIIFKNISDFVTVFNVSRFFRTIILK